MTMGMIATFRERERLFDPAALAVWSDRLEVTYADRAGYVRSESIPLDRIAALTIGGNAEADLVVEDRDGTPYEFAFSGGEPTAREIKALVQSLIDEARMMTTD
jgi:hypothetical protein